MQRPRLNVTDDSDDEGPDLDDPPIGYCNPPPEYHWVKGYCPNPAGRPRKKPIMKDFKPLNEFQQRVLEEARKVLTQVDGKPFTRLDKLLLQLETSDRPEDRKLLLSYFQDALTADYAWREQAVRDLVAYKQNWGPQFEAARRRKQALPDIYPDPDDIVILSPTEFRFLGPVTPEEAADWKYFIRGRQFFVMYASQIVETAGHYRPLEEAHQLYLKIRRAFYRANRVLPKTFKKKHPVKFPPFSPTTELPEGYFDEPDVAKAG